MESFESVSFVWGDFEADSIHMTYNKYINIGLFKSKNNSTLVRSNRRLPVFQIHENSNSSKAL